jgi:hypothetical protein
VRKSKVFLSLACSTLLLSTVSLPATATPDTDFTVGMEAYKSKKYAVAASYLQSAATAGLSTPALWMYLGHAYIAQGDRKHAAEAYAGLISNFKGTPEAHQALGYLNRIDPNAGKRALMPPVDVRKLPLKDRVVIVPPRSGHPPVSNSFVSAIRGSLAKLPPNIYKILNDGGATINLAPNIEDKWPGSGDGDKPTEMGVTMGEEPARTYGHDLHIYERAKLRGVDTLGPARSTSSLVNSFLFEVGHAVDDITGLPSKNPEFKKQFQLDLRAMNPDRLESLQYYTVSMQCYAAMVAGLLGSDRDSIEEALRCFPRSKLWVKAQLKL